VYLRAAIAPGAVAAITAPAGPAADSL